MGGKCQYNPGKVDNPVVSDVFAEIERGNLYHPEYMMVEVGLSQEIVIDVTGYKYVKIKCINES